MGYTCDRLGFVSSCHKLLRTQDPDRGQMDTGDIVRMHYHYATSNLFDSSGHEESGSYYEVRSDIEQNLAYFSMFVIVRTECTRPWIDLERDFNLGEVG